MNTHANLHDQLLHVSTGDCCLCCDGVVSAPKVPEQQMSEAHEISHINKEQ